MQRAGSLWRVARRACTGAMLLAGTAAVQGCKTQEDAIAASQQMALTAATMQRYYAALDSLIQSNEDVQRAQGYLTQVPLDAATASQLEDARQEIGKRAKLAEEIAKISGSFAEITNSEAASEAATAAGALNDQLVSLKVGASSDAAAKALKIAVASLVNAVRAHDEVKAAKLLDPVLVALCGFYDSEKLYYVSLADSYYVTAASNAKALIQQNQVSTNERYRSSLEPFGLSPDVHAAALLQAAHDDMNQQVDRGLLQHKQDDAAAADALGDALHRMQARVDVVAKGRALGVRTPPLTLEGVKVWIAEVVTETGVSL